MAHDSLNDLRVLNTTKNLVLEKSRIFCTFLAHILLLHFAHYYLHICICKAHIWLMGVGPVFLPFLPVHPHPHPLIFVVPFRPKLGNEEVKQRWAKYAKNVQIMRSAYPPPPVCGKSGEVDPPQHCSYKGEIHGMY